MKNLEVGDVVTLKSGSLPMTVLHINELATIRPVNTTWMYEGQVYSESFPEAALCRYIPEGS